MRGTKGISTSLGSVAALAALVLALSACSAPALKGTDLGKDPAPDFKLADPTGAAVSLSDFRGKAIVLTFLYTHCPAECPLIANKLYTVSGILGEAMKNVALVAVSVDPANDTPIAIAKFLQDHHLAGQLHYLSGTEAELEPVWKDYALYVAADPTDAATQVISHTSRVIVIDKSGRQRVNLGSDLDPNDLAFDLTTVLAE